MFIIKIAVKPLSPEKYCQFYKQELCLSCDQISLSYEAQIAAKEASIKAAKYPNFDFEIHPFVVSPEKYNYRNYGKIAVSGTATDPVLGFYGADGEVINIDQCLVHHPHINELLPVLKSIISELKLHPYSVKSKSGELRYFLIRYFESTGELLLRAVLFSRSLVKRIEKNKDAFFNQIPSLKAFSLNINSTRSSIIEGSEEIFIGSSKFIEDTFGDKSLFLTAGCFYQVNSSVAEKLYRKSAELISSQSFKVLADLYCGVGGFSVFCSDYVDRVLAIEISKMGIYALEHSIQKSKNENITAICDTAGAIYEKMKNKGPDVLIVNPPRGGIMKTDLEEIMKMGPEMILYSSCNLNSLLRDILFFHEAAYHLKDIFPFDMFPQTNHFEILARLEKKS